MNDLIQSQQQSQASGGSDADPGSCSDSSTPKCSPELQRSQLQQSNADLADTSSYSGSSWQSQQHKNQANHSDGAVPPSSTQISHNSGENQLPRNESNSEHTQPMFKYPYTPVLPLDQSLPPLHPDVLQQRFTGDISMLPVPRIMFSGGRAAGGTTYMSHLGAGGGADFTLDENMQMADMIALKYLGRKNELNTAPDYNISGKELQFVTVLPIKLCLLPYTSLTGDICNEIKGEIYFFFEIFQVEKV